MLFRKDTSANARELNSLGERKDAKQKRTDRRGKSVRSGTDTAGHVQL